MKSVLFFLLSVTMHVLMAQTLIDFPNQPSFKNWQIVNDDVMGGISNSKMYLNEENMAVFEGRVSLENYGGFCSVRHDLEKIPTEGKTTLVLKLKGDGKNYQLRIKANRRDYASYVKEFSTTGQWQEVRIALKDMYPSFRGRRLNRSNFEGDYFSQLSLLIGNKKAERFSLEIESIQLQ